MQFDKDINSPLSKLFLEIRAYIMDCIDDDNSNIRENLKPNLTSYFHKDFKSGFCYIRVKDDFVHIGWFRGASIKDEPKQFFGDGKCIRGQKIRKLNIETKKAITYYINQTKLILFDNMYR